MPVMLSVIYNPMAIQEIRINVLIARDRPISECPSNTSITEFIKYTPGIKNKTLVPIATSGVLVEQIIVPI